MKQKRWMRVIRNGVCLCLIAAAYLGGLHFYERMQAEKETVFVTLKGAYPNQEEAEKIEELEEEQKEACDFTLWAHAGEVTLENRELARSAEASALAVKSRPELVLPQVGALKAGDTSGCVIDEKTAEALFGGTGAEGQRLFYEDREYTVRQVVKSRETLFLYLPASGSGQVYTMLSLKVPETKSRKEEAETFLMRYHLQGEVSDSSILSAAAFGTLLLLPIALALTLLVWMREAGREGGKAAKLIWMAATAGVLLLFLYQAGRCITISPDMLPGRWSDFSFWSDKLEEKTEGLYAFMKGVKSPGQMEALIAFGKSCACSLAACLGYFCLFLPPQKKEENGREWLSKSREALPPELP